MALLIQKDTVTERQESGILSCRHCAGSSSNLGVERLGPDQKKGLVQLYPRKSGRMEARESNSFRMARDLSFFQFYYIVQAGFELLDSASLAAGTTVEYRNA